jgi:hypothetical protein
VSRRAEAALEARRRVLGSADPRCSVAGCTEDDPRALTGAEPSVLCAEHAAARDGRSPSEDHHIAGRRNHGATAPIPANSHAALTFLQQTAWPAELLRNPKADPLLRAAASIRGSRETAEVINAKIMAPIETDLLQLSKFLREQLGEDWAARFAAWREAEPDGA